MAVLFAGDEPTQRQYNEHHQYTTKDTCNDTSDDIILTYTETNARAHTDTYTQTYTYNQDAHSKQSHIPQREEISVEYNII